MMPMNHEPLKKEKLKHNKTFNSVLGTVLRTPPQTSTSNNDLRAYQVGVQNLSRASKNGYVLHFPTTNLF